MVDTVNRADAAGPRLSRGIEASISSTMMVWNQIEVMPSRSSLSPQPPESMISPEDGEANLSLRSRSRGCAAEVLGEIATPAHAIAEYLNGSAPSGRLDHNVAYAAAAIMVAFAGERDLAVLSARTSLVVSGQRFCIYTLQAGDAGAITRLLVVL